MSHEMTPERQYDTINRTLNKRKRTPLEVAKVIDFLLHEDTGYMNGSIVHLNNGIYIN